MPRTIGRRSKPALLINPPPVSTAQPSCGKTRGAAAPYQTATGQMLPGPAIHRAPTTAMTNFSQAARHSFAVRFVAVSEAPLGLGHDNHARSHRQYDFAPFGIPLDAIFNCDANRVQ